MNKPLPDKYIRQAISALINNQIVDGVMIPCYDTKVTRNANSELPQHYVLMTAQGNTVDKNNKCEWFYDSNILLDITTTYPLPGNPGSRLLADDIAESCRQLLNNFQLDPASGLEIFTQTFSWPGDLSTSTSAENVFRKMFRIELTIK